MSYLNVLVDEPAGRRKVTVPSLMTYNPVYCSGNLPFVYVDVFTGLRERPEDKSRQPATYI